MGDAFCGGGSVPFEAARIGCDAYGSDLNPVAALLTWGALNIIGGGPEVAERVRKAQEEVYAAADCQITEWGIEHNEKGERADAYLYCAETRCPECGWMVPMAPTWVIGEKTHTIARLVPDPSNKRFDIEIEQGVSEAEIGAAKHAGTSKDARLICPNGCPPTPIVAIRGDRRGEGGTEFGLRLWENDDLVPRPDDVFQERLYCIRWVVNPPSPLAGEGMDGGEGGRRKLSLLRRVYRGRYGTRAPCAGTAPRALPRLAGEGLRPQPADRAG